LISDLNPQTEDKKNCCRTSVVHFFSFTQKKNEQIQDLVDVGEKPNAGHKKIKLRKTTEITFTFDFTFHLIRKQT
jgi:hypothetical protein